MEVASGAASCVPGVGQYASLGKILCALIYNIFIYTSISVIDLAIAAEESMEKKEEKDEDQERKIIDLMKQIEECRERKKKLDQAFEWLKIALESAKEKSGNNDDLTRIMEDNFEDFTDRCLKSCLEIF